MVSVIENIITNKNPGTDRFIGELYQILKDLPILLKLFQKLKDKLILCGRHHPDTKKTQGHHRKRKL